MNVLRLGVFLILSLMSGVVYAQTGKPIRGIVTDGSSGQPIEFSTIVVLNASVTKGTMTDSIGEFVIENITI